MLPLALLSFYRARILSFTGDIHEGKESAKYLSAIEIPSIAINNNIEEGAVVNNIWYVSKENAVHLVTSKNPGEGGNIVVYGHNTHAIFQNLPKINIGDEIILRGNDGQTFKYKVKETHTVRPTEINYIQDKEKETLTLYTCTGFFDSKRLIVIAEPSFY